MRFILVLLAVMSGCSGDSKVNLNAPPQLNQTLKVLVRNSPTIYYFGREGEPEGFEYELVTHFANFVGAKVDFEVVDSLSNILTKLERGETDFVAAGITRTPEREGHFLFGPDYKAVKQQLVCHRKTRRIKSEGQLVGLRLLVAAKTSYISTLNDLKAKHSQLEWEVSPDLSTEEILQRVAERKIDCTLADSDIATMNRRYFPELRIQRSLTGKEPLAWALPRGEMKLQFLMNAWFARMETQEFIAFLKEKYFGYVKLFDYVDIRKFKRRIRSTLPKYKKNFKQEAKKYGFAWTLLAAQAYQESHWDQKASSPTGVRGLMMLTQNTAEGLGIKNRLDPKQSIEGGAKYLQRMRKRLPKEIKEPARTWFALAAYNVGFAHLQDARSLAEHLNKNPNRWRDMQEILPLLSQRQYYKTLKYGYARGLEPVRYVRRIRNYEDVLLQKLGKR